MKKLFLMALIALTAMPMIAQQTLYTRDGRTIKGYVVDINDDNISYTQDKSMEAATESISTQDVYNIVFENGSFQIVTPIDLVEDKGSIISQPLQELQYERSKRISYGNMQISESEWLALANKFGVDRKYEVGKTLRRVGKPLWMAGVGCIIAGAITYIAGNQNQSYATSVIGESLTIFGAPLVVVGIPLHATGTHLQKKSYEEFNLKANTKQ